MAWSKSLDQNFKLQREENKKQAEAKQVQQTKKKQNTFYGDYRSKQQSDNTQNTQGNTFQRAVSENPFTPVKTKLYQSYQDRKKSGNVFTPTTVLGSLRKSNSAFTNNPIYGARYREKEQRENNTMEWFQSKYGNGNDLNSQIVNIPITDQKNITLRYGTAAAIDEIINDKSEKNKYKRADKIDKMIEAMGLEPEELKNAKSYAGLRKLSFISSETGKNSALKEITQPAAKFIKGLYDAGDSASRFMIKDGFKLNGEYSKELSETEKYYRENPDALGNDLLGDRTWLDTVSKEYLTNLEIDKALEWYNDTNKVTRFISDAGFESAGQMLGAYGMAGVTGLSDATQALGNIASNAATATKAGSAISKVTSISPKVAKITDVGLKGKVANAAIDKINGLSIGAAAKFLNPVDNPTTALMGIGAAQDKYDQLKYEGYDEKTARENAALTGYVNAVGEKMGYNGKFPINNSFFQYLMNNVGEAGEEVLTGWLERAVDRATGVGYVDENGDIQQRKLVGKEGIIDAANMMENATGGFVGGFVMGAPNQLRQAHNAYNTTVNEGRLAKSLGETQNIIERGIDRDNKTSAYKYADKLQSKQAAGKDISDWNVGQQIQKNDKALDGENRLANTYEGLTGIPNEAVESIENDANGRFIPNEKVEISKHRDTSYPETLRHEYGVHAIKQQAPEQFKKFEDYVNSVVRFSDNIPYESAVQREEVAALVLEKMNITAPMLEKIANGDITLADKTKIIDGINKASAKLKDKLGKTQSLRFGGEISNEHMLKAFKLYKDVIRTAAQNKSQNSMSDVSSSMASDVKYSPIETNSKGKYVQADRQVINSENPAEWEGQIYNYINDKIRNGQDVIIPTEDGDNLTISEKTAWKMGYRNEVDSGNGKQQISKDLYRTKINAAAHIDELAEISKRGKKNAPDTKNHGFAQVGFNYRTAYFRDLDGQYYKLTISVGENSEQKTVYNIGKIERVPFPDINAQRQSGNKTASAKKNSFNNSISENGDNVKYSVKENTANRITTDIIKENGSTIKKNEIVDDVRAVYELLANGEVTDKKYRAAWDIAENIGQRVAQGIQITDSEMYDNYKDLRNTLRNTPISISDADRADITDVDSFNEFRRKNFGSLRITNDGTRIDQFYQELSELYPNFFDAEKETHPADQLMQIEKVLQDMKPKTHGLSDAEIGEAAGDIASKLITDIINNTSVKMSDSEYDDWDSLMTGEEAKRQEKLQERSREKEFAEGLPQGRQGRQGVIDELSQDIRQEVELLKGDGSLISKYNAESASRIDKKEFTKSDIIPAIKNYGVGFMTREVDKLYPIKAYERYAQNQMYGKDKIQFRGKNSPYVMSSNSIDAESRAKYILTEKATDFDANEIGESLADIVGELGYDDYKDFNTYLKLKHGLEWIDFKNNDYKPVFNNKILNSYEAMQAGINELEAKHSDFMGLAKRVYDYQGKLMQAWLVDTGIITQKQFDILREKYPCYVPFFRKDDTPTTHFRPKKGIANQSNPIMQAEGGGQKIYDPIENIMINTSRFVNAAAKNSAMQAVVNVYDTVPNMEHYMAEVVKDADGKYILKDKNHQASNETDTDIATEEYISDMVQHAIKLTDGDIVTVLENGEKRYFKVFDRYFLNALDNMRPIQSGAVMRAVASATRVFSALATSNNPVFTLASNPIKDTQNAFMQTTQKNPFAVVTAILDAQVEQFKNSDIGKRIGQKSNADYDGTEIYKKYMAMGGEYASAFSSGRSAMKEALADIKPGKGGTVEKAENAVKFVPRLYGNVADAIETGPRLGEFKYSNGKAGNDVHQAHFDSKNVTLNFGRSGTVGEKINKFVPFYNPSVQGISMMVQNFKNKPFQTSMRVGVGIALSVLLSAFNKRDDESEEAYENASAYLKNNYYLFHIKDGKFIKIPKSQEYGLAPSLVERVIEKYAYDNPDAFYNYADYLSTALLPSLLQAEFPFVDTGSVIGLGTYTSILENKDFKGSPIVPDYLQDEVPEMQYDERTSYIARWIGKELKWSPKKIDYVIKSNTGFLGKINESIGHSGERDWSMGASTKFTADSLFSTDKTNMFYENRDEADKQAKSYPSADNEYLSKRFSQSGKMMSILNAMYKENRNDSKGREIRKAYIDYAAANKDNPTGYSDEVYDKIKYLFDTDNKVLSLPSVDRIIKAKIGKETKSYTFNDAESILQYQSDLNKNVDEAYRELLSDVAFNSMSDIDKVSALSKAKKNAADEVKRFYIENEGGKVMFNAGEHTEITVPSDSAMREYNAKKERHMETQSKIQSVVDNLAQSTPDKAEYYSMPKLTEFDIRSVKIEGKSYDIKGDILTRVTEAATDNYYSNVDKLTNNELNIEDVIGYTKKGKAHTATDASGNKVALTGRMYNSDGTPRFDDLIMAKILEDVKEASRINAINQYQSEITGGEEVKTIAQEQKKFTTARASGRKSGGGKRSSGSRKSSSSGGKTDIHFTRAMANAATKRSQSRSIAALPDTVSKQAIQSAANAVVKNKGLPNTVKMINNPLFM